MLLNVNKKYVFFFITFFSLCIKALCGENNTTWTPFNTGLYGGNVQAIAVDPDNFDHIYVGTLGGGFYYSQNGGQTWNSNSSTLRSWDILSLLVIKGNGSINIYAGTSDGIYRLEGLDSDWSEDPVFLDGKYINLLKRVKSNSPFFFAGSGSYNGENSTPGLWRIDSELDTVSEPIQFGTDSNPQVFDILVTDDQYRFHVGTDQGYFRFWEDENEIDQKLTDYAIYNIAEDEDVKAVIFVGTNKGGLFSENDGLDWYTDTNKFLADELITSLPTYYHLVDQKVRGKVIYAGTKNSKIFRWTGIDPKVWNSIDNTNLPELPVKNIIINAERLSELYVANRLGVYFSNQNAGFCDFKNNSGFSAHRIHDIICAKGVVKKLFAGSDAAIFEKNISVTNSDWLPVSGLNENVTSITFDSQDDYIYVSTIENSIFRKLDETGDWEQAEGVNKKNNTTIVRKNNNQFLVGIGDSGLYKINHFHDEWEKINIKELNTARITDILFNNHNSDIAYISTLNNGAFKVDLSTPQVLGEWNKTNIHDLAISTLSDSIFAGTKNGLFCSDDFGDWCKYPPLNSKQNIMKLEIVPTETSFSDVLYAMSLQEHRKTVIYRNIIGTDKVVESDINSINFQHGESICLDIDDPNIVYLGTAGSGVQKYVFPIVAPTIKTALQGFGDVAKDTTRFDTLVIKNEDDFMPLIIKSSLSDTTEYNVVTKDLIIKPMEEKDFILSFKPDSNLESEATLKIERKDIFLNTSLKIIDGQVIILNDTGKYAEFDIDSVNHNDTLEVVFDSTHVGCTDSIIIPWKNEGNVTLKDFCIDFPDTSLFDVEGLQKNSCSENEQGEITISFSPATMDTVLDSVVINYKYYVDGKCIKGKTKVIKLIGVGRSSKYFTVPEDTVNFGNIPILSSTSKQLQIINDGNISFSIDSLYGLDGANFSMKNEVERELKFGDTIFVELNFAPIEEITYQDTLFIEYRDSLDCDTASASDAILLVGTGINTILKFNYPNFKNTHRDSIKRTKFLKIENLTSDYEAKICTVFVENGPFEIDSASLDSLLKTPITYENSVKLKIYFNPYPSALDTFIKQITIKYKILCNDTTKCDTNVVNCIEDSLHGNIVFGELTIEQNEWISDKEVHVEDSISKFFTLTHEGNLKVHYKVDGLASPFTLDSPDEGCLLPDSDEDENIEVKFEPLGINWHDETLKVTCWDLPDSGGILNTIEVPLDGRGADAIGIFTADTFSCKGAHVGDTTQFHVDVSNTGNIAMVSISAECDSPVYHIINSAPSEIDSGITTPINIEFIPDSSISYPDSLKIRYSDSFWKVENKWDTIKCAINGTGYKAYLKVYDDTCETRMDSIAFPNIPRNTPSDEKLRCFKNTGNLTLYIDDLPEIDGLTITGISNNDSLQPNESRIVTFQYTSNEVGGFNEDLILKYHDKFENKTYTDSTILTLTGSIEGADFAVADSVVNFGDVLIKTECTIIRNIRNQGTLSGTIDSVHCKLPFYDSSMVVGAEIDTNSCLEIVICFSPERLGQHDSTCTIFYHDTSDYVDSLILSLQGKGIDTVAPVVGFKDTVSIKMNTNNKSIYAKIYDVHSGVYQDSVRLWIRKGGDKDFGSISHNSFIANDTTFEFLIPSEYITSRGIDFYFECCDSAGNSIFHGSGNELDYFSPKIKIDDEDEIKSPNTIHTGDAQQDYRLISIPIQVDDGKKSAKDILFSSLGVNNYDQTLWRCADYHHYSETDSFIYLNSADFSPFEPGKAFFLLATENFSGKYIQSKSGFTNTTNDTFKIALHKGWNLIGNPYDFLIPIENTCINNGLPEVWEYSGQWRNDVTSIEPWQGYAIYVENNDTLRIKPDLRYPYFESGLAKSVNSNQFEWFIKINVSCQNAQNNENIAAVAEKASHGFDHFDKPEPPPIGQYVMLTFPHPEWNKAFDYFTVDVQAPNVDGNFWDFNVYSNIKNGEVTLDFTNLDVVPQEYDIKLIGNNLTRPVKLRKESKISYVSNNEAGYEKFRLLVGSSEFVNENDNSLVPSEFCLYPNFPNPFNNSTNICFDVPEQIEGDIYIFNVTGSQVKTIAKNKLFEPGKIILTWDGTNDQNFSVSSGIYFCKIITRKYSNTIKMVLIR